MFLGSRNVAANKLGPASTNQKLSVARFAMAWYQSNQKLNSSMGLRMLAGIVPSGWPHKK
jgi:hypothetical protein